MCSGPAYLVAFGKTTQLTKSKSGDRAADDPCEAELDGTADASFELDDMAEVLSELDDTADAPPNLDDMADVVSELDDSLSCTRCGRIPCDCDGLEAAHRLLWFPETAASGGASGGASGNPSGSAFGSPSGGAFGSPFGSPSGGRSLLSLRAPVHVKTETFLVSSSHILFNLLIPWYQSFHGLVTAVPKLEQFVA